MSIHGVANIRCPYCDNPKFVIVHHKNIVVDFSQEGAIENHPFVTDGGESFDSISCDNCFELIEGDLVHDILREVI